MSFLCSLPTEAPTGILTLVSFRRRFSKVEWGLRGPVWLLEDEELLKYQAWHDLGEIYKHTHKFCSILTKGEKLIKLYNRNHHFLDNPTNLGDVFPSWTSSTPLTAGFFFLRRGTCVSWSGGGLSTEGVRRGAGCRVVRCVVRRVVHHPTRLDLAGERAKWSDRCFLFFGGGIKEGTLHEEKW